MTMQHFFGEDEYVVSKRRIPGYTLMGVEVEYSIGLTADDARWLRPIAEAAGRLAVVKRLDWVIATEAADRARDTESGR
jgi:hypothetical protein